MRSIDALVGIVCLVLSVSAYADGQTEYGRGYFTIEGGVLIPSSSSTSIVGIPIEVESAVGGTVGLRLGGHLHDHVRLDGLLAWHGASPEQIVGPGATLGFTGDVNLLTATANLAFDVLPRDAIFNPFLEGGVGLGAAWFEPTGSTAFLVAESSGVGFAYLAGGGMHIRVADSLRLKVGYRYVGTVALFDAAEIVFDEDVDISGHEVVVGLQKEF